jgi:gliding motility-associated-like protein
MKLLLFALVTLILTSTSIMGQQDSTFYVPASHNQFSGPQLPSYFHKNKSSGSSAVAQSTLPAFLPRMLQDISAKQNSLCNDTSQRFFLRNDSIRYYAGDPCYTRDGNILIGGEYVLMTQPFVGKTFAFVLKSSPSGNIIWHKVYDSLNQVKQGFTNFYKILELDDGSIFIGGSKGYNASQNVELLCAQLTPAGNMIWNRKYRSRLWTSGSGSADYFYVQQMKQDPISGDVFITGPLWDKGAVVIRMAPATGNIAWSNSYGHNYGDRVFGLDIKLNEIRLFMRSSFSTTSWDVIKRINKSTGDTIVTRFFKCDDTAAIKLQLLQTDPLRVLANGNYVISGACIGSSTWQWNGTTPLFQAAVKEYDSNLNFVRAFAFRNPIASNQYNSRITVFPDGTGYFSMLEYFSSFTSNVYEIEFSNTQLLRQRKKHYYGEGLPWEPPAIRPPDGSTLIVRRHHDSTNSRDNIEFMRLRLSDSSSNCLGYDYNITTVYPFTCSPVMMGYDSVRSNVFESSGTVSLTANDFPINYYPACYQVSYCDSLQLLAPQSAICLGQPLFVRSRRNAGCSSSIQWRYDAATVSSMHQVNDTVTSFLYNSPYSGYIYGSLQGCNVITDSVYVNILLPPGGLDLGPDTVICPGNSIVLNARRGFASYSWHDGSTDSVFVANQPGTYYATTTSACGGTYSDTVHITAHPPIPISAGMDRVKCNSDTVHLSASAGFISYSWSPPYRISNVNVASVVVDPLVDTTYYLKAEKSAGCYAFDSVRITVHHSPSIILGMDTSLCNGDSLWVDAGAGFTSYAWNTGATSQRLKLTNPGTYSVTGTASNNCRSYDTLRIIAVHSLPVVSLDDRNYICSGTTRTLNAGTFNSYLWNNGSTAPTMMIGVTGNYHVTVTDINGCHGSDTVTIDTVIPSPAGFLGADTAICSYENIILKPSQLFSTYQWNTGSTSPELSISNAGTYSLTVTDLKGCRGFDTVTVQPKECMQGFYMPTAFTPNNDYRNDRIKPMLFGKVLQYEFHIYNRFGQVIFHTSSATDSWDGNFMGAAQHSQTFIWKCIYQFEGEPVNSRSGTFLLIR